MDQDRKTAMGREALQRELRAYGAAGRTLNEWISGARALALSRGALSSGIFDARTPSTAAEISSATGVEGLRVADLCLALEAHGVFERDGESYRLSEDYAVLVSLDPCLAVAPGHGARKAATKRSPSARSTSTSRSRSG